MAAYARRSYSEVAVVTTLSGSINDSVESLSIATTTGWPTGGSGNFYINIGTETIDCASRSSTTITVQSGGRGALGSSAAAHLAGVEVTLVFTSNDADEANYVVSQTVGKIAAAGDLLYGSAANTLSKLAKGTSGTFLKQGASIPSWAALTTADVSGSVTDDMFHIGSAAPSSPTEGSYWYDTSNNRVNIYNGTVWVTTNPNVAAVQTQQSTTSTSYTDLGTVGPAVTLLTGTTVLLELGAAMTAASSDACVMAIAVSGATTLSAAAFDTAFGQVYATVTGSAANMSASRPILVTGLTAGANTFTVKYKSASGGAAAFSNRVLCATGLVQ